MKPDNAGPISDPASNTSSDARSSGDVAPADQTAMPETALEDLRASTAVAALESAAFASAAEEHVIAPASKVGDGAMGAIDAGQRSAIGAASAPKNAARAPQ